MCQVPTLSKALEAELKKKKKNPTLLSIYLELNPLQLSYKFLRDSFAGRLASKQLLPLHPLLPHAPSHPRTVLRLFLQMRAVLNWATD